jgi:hypothetical protein
MKKLHEQELQVAGAALLAAIDLTVAEARKAKSTGQPFNDQTFLRGAFCGIHYVLLLNNSNGQDEPLHWVAAEEARS